MAGAMACTWTQHPEWLPSVTIPLNGNHLFLTASAVAESVNLADVSVTNNIVSFAGVPLGTVFNGTPENDTISGLSGGDNSVTGTGGIDTVNFTETLTASDFELSSGNWITTTATEGSDILQGVEVVKDGGGHTFLLVGGGGACATPDETFAPQRDVRRATSLSTRSLRMKYLYCLLTGHLSGRPAREPSPTQSVLSTTTPAEP